jgi:hypothetical protein
LVVELGKLLESWTIAEEGGKRRFVLVFDGIDHQRDAPPTLLPALARLGEIVRFSHYIHQSCTNHPRYPTSRPSSSSPLPAPSSSTPPASHISPSPPTQNPKSLKSSPSHPQHHRSPPAQKTLKKSIPASVPQSTTPSPSTQAATSSPSGTSALASGPTSSALFSPAN